MKQSLLLLLLVCFLTATNAQAQKKTLKKTAELVMPGDVGSNGASVVWHPLQKKYYAAMAGNAIYPFSVFDIKGKRISDESLEAGNDLRGLWYNTKTKSIDGNCYDSAGWVTYKLDAKGLPTAPEIILSGMYQPTGQSVGVYNTKLNAVYFLSVTGVSVYDIKGTETNMIALKMKKDGDDIMFDDDNTLYNTKSLIYTGIPKMELGLLNTEEGKIELFNGADGLYTKDWLLPKDAPLNSVFNFAYANGIVWLFSKEDRKWVGYK